MSACLNPAINWLLLVIAAIVVLCVMTFTVMTTTQIYYRKTGVVKVLLNYFQLLSFLLFLDVLWPPVFDDVRPFCPSIASSPYGEQTLGVASVSTLQLNLAPVDCIFRLNFYNYFIIYSILPLIGLVFASLVFIIGYLMAPFLRKHRIKLPTVARFINLMRRMGSSIAGFFRRVCTCDIFAVSDRCCC